MPGRRSGPNNSENLPAAISASVAKVWFGPIFILSGETGNRTAGSVPHIAQTGTGTTMNSSDRFGSHSDMKPLALWLLTSQEQHPHLLNDVVCCVHCHEVDIYIILYYIILYYIILIWMYIYIVREQLGNI